MAHMRSYLCEGAKHKWSFNGDALTLVVVYGRRCAKREVGRKLCLTKGSWVKVLTQGALLLHRWRRYDSFAVWRRPKRTKVGGVLCRCPVYKMRTYLVIGNQRQIGIVHAG